uniref:Glutamic acid-rich protein-like n=1 Tax=Tanacetum cinerariifolium TaxID=118510 RepID=A0A6L2KZD9_TANCI|nr:hypothetical protein [Tanacetum cinerariifolium]
MSTPTFAETHNLIAFLEKPTESDGFEQIIDFLNANPIKLDDAEGTTCLPNAVIFKELARMGYEKPSQKLTFYKAFFSPQWKFLIHTILQWLSAKTTAWNEFSSTMTSAIICLANNQKFNFSKYILDNMVKNLEAEVKFYMFPRFVQVFMNHQLGDISYNKGIFVNPSLTKKLFANMKRAGTSFSRRKHKSRRKQRKATETNQAAEIKKLKKRVKKLEGKKKKRTHGLKRLYKVGLTARVESFEEEEGLGDQDDASKQGRIAEIDADEDLSLINETAQDQGRMNDEDLFGVNDLDGDEVIVDVTVEPSEFRTTSPSQPSQPLHAKDKGKGIMVEPEKPLKNKDQFAFDKEVAKKLDTQMKAKIEEEERIVREKNEANRVVIENGMMFKLQLIKYFAAKRAEEIRNKPPIKERQKSLMCTYMKNTEGYKQKDFKGKSFDAIKKMFDKVYKRVNTFVAMDSEVIEGSKKTQAEVTKGSSKRAGDEIEQESAKRQRLKKEDDTTELKRCLEIVPENDDDVTIKATPISSKSPTIKIYKEGKKSYFKIIRADGNLQNYLTFEIMFKNFNREDLEVLKSIVKERFKKTKPVNDMDNLLFQTLKTMFEHHVEDNI